jgi:sialic acid synthase SpsE
MRLILVSNHNSVRRPRYGLHPKYWDDIAGKKVNRDIKKETRFEIEFITKS